jgi:hypothetical protein
MRGIRSRAGTAMGKGKPNAALGRLLEESGLTETQFARAVNRVAAESGVSVRYDQPSVSQWLNGTIPRAVVRPFVAEALSRRLGRPVTLADVGFPAPPAAPENRTFARTVEELVDLVKSDMDPSRRGVLNAGLYSVALTIPGWPEIVGRMEAVRKGRARRIGMADVDAVSAMIDQLSDLDGRFGGGYARPLAAAFIANTVAPYLRADGPENVRKAMIAKTALLCYLTGWMTVDEGLHGLAQRYYTKGLQLAGAAEDHMTYCHILRGMSVQAVDRGYGSRAVDLANASSATTPTAGPRMRAFIAGQQAHSFAVAGDRTGALRSIKEAETAMDKAETPAVTFGGYNPSTLAYHIAQVRYGLGDVSGSVTSLQLHFRLRVPGDSRRSAVRFGAMLAERQLEVGHLEAACVTWNRVLDDYPTVHSGRTDERVRRIQPLLRPYVKNAAAREVSSRVRDILADRQRAVRV